ncbi:hypothetical protein OIU35_00210 [Boseaceae bacterium BT-24-1]|nr:hypothetical protein [Boseaceae bacterium BT-24-1]
MIGLVDRYTLLARVGPAVLVGMAACLAVTAWIPFAEWPIKLAAGSTVLAIVAMVLGQLVRDAGKAIEKPLWAKWDGPPTARMLRHRDEAMRPGLKASLHARMVELGLVEHMPTKQEEAENPDSADVIYQTCSDRLRNKALELKAKSPFDVVHQENISYGFRRNLLGIRTWALCIVALSFLGGAAAFLQGRYPYLEVGGIILIAVAILASANETALKRTADNYSERLLNAVDSLPQRPPTAAVRAKR